MNPELESRIHSLEKQVKRQRWIGIAVGLCVVAALTVGAALDEDEVHDVLKARSIVVSDGEGKDSALLSKSGVLYFDGKGKPMALYSNLGITLYGRGSENDAIVIIGQSDDGDSGSISVRNKAGEMVAIGDGE